MDEVKPAKGTTNAVREIREALGMTEGELAYRLSVSPQEIEEYERNSTLPNDTAAATNLRMLADQIGVQIA